MVKPFSLYRHFKGNLYLVTGVANTASTLETVVVYVSLTDFQVWTRELSEFESLVPEGKENPTGQKHRFELVTDSKSILGQCTTQNLIEELKKRPDSPFNELDINGLNDKVVDKEYVVGDLDYSKADGHPILNTLYYSDSLEEAKLFLERNFHRASSRTKVYKSILVEVESFD